MVLVRTTGPTLPRPGSLPDRQQSVLDMLALIQVEKNGPQPQSLSLKLRLGADLKFVKKITRPNFRAKEFYTLKMRKSRLLSPAINSKNASLSVIWPSFG